MGRLMPASTQSRYHPLIRWPVLKKPGGQVARDDIALRPSGASEPSLLLRYLITDGDRELLIALDRFHLQTESIE